MAAIEAASGFGRIELAQGLSALSTAVRHVVPSVLAVLEVRWSRLFAGALTAPAFLSSWAPMSAQTTALGQRPHGGSTIGSGITLDAVLDMVRRTAGGSVDADMPLMDAGVDSLGAVELRNQLQSAVGPVTVLPSTLIFDYPTARQLATMVQVERAACCLVKAERSDVAEHAVDGSVAIQGSSAVLPACASSAVLVHRAVFSGLDAVTQVPVVRWDVVPKFAEAVARRLRHGGFVHGVELADNAAFAISAAECSAMDPCQRLLLEQGYAALHDASLDRAALNGSLAGVFLGFSGSDFSELLKGLPAHSSVYSATGSSSSIASGRVSYVLGLHGPSASYDTACSSALVAEHAGLCALRLGEASAGLVAGVTLMLLPTISTSFAVAGMTSARGRSHTFDSRADGYARGEACGAMAVLLSTEEHATVLLRGSAVQQDGRSASLTAPNGRAQQGVMIAAVTDARVDANRLGINEAHGTGTALGDPIEAGSMAAALFVRHRKISCTSTVVGGVKANIGHAEPAAGMTGSLKLALELQRLEAGPNAQLRSLNPKVGEAIEGVKGRMLLVQHVLPRMSAASGGVSSFGYSGTIAHAILDRARSAAPGLTSERVDDAVHISEPSRLPLAYHRITFAWRSETHPFAQRVVHVPIGRPSTVSRSPAAGALHRLVADHVVQGRVIFPGAGYLEMARAAASDGAPAAMFHEVFFVQPLVVETADLHVECEVVGSRVQVRSSTTIAASGLMEDSVVHCSATVGPTVQWERIDHAALRGSRSALAADIRSLYECFDVMGLQYGPGYRTLTQAWCGGGTAVSRLGVHAIPPGVRVHPADLDDALCSGALVSSNQSGPETHLPFAVDEAQLGGKMAGLLAVCCGKVTVVLKWQMSSSLLVRLRLLAVLLSESVVELCVLASAACGVVPSEGACVSVTFLFE